MSCFQTPRRIFLAFALTASIHVAAAEIPILDAHSQLDRDVALAQVIDTMDKAGVSRVILSSLRANTKTRDIIEGRQQHPGRIVASIGMKGEVKSGNPEALRRLRAQGEGPVFGAVSELMLFHMQKGVKAPEIIRALDDPEAKAALEVVQKRGWPLVIHIEFAYARSVGAYERNMTELKSLLDAVPTTNVALTHMGQLSAVDVLALAKAHKNVHFLTSHANTAYLNSRGNRNAHWVNLFAGEKLADDWRNAILAHPDRFIMAFDNVYNEDWTGEHYPAQVALWKSALLMLPDDVAHQIAHRNAERLWGLKPL